MYGWKTIRGRGRGDIKQKKRGRKVDAHATEQGTNNFKQKKRNARRKADGGAIKGSHDGGRKYPRGAHGEG